MKKNSIKLLIIGTAFASVLSGCGDGWFERDPKNILTNDIKKVEHTLLSFLPD